MNDGLLELYIDFHHLSIIIYDVIELPNSLESLTLIKYRYEQLNLPYNLKYLDLKDTRCKINYNENIKYLKLRRTIATHNICEIPQTITDFRLDDIEPYNSYLERYNITNFNNLTKLHIFILLTPIDISLLTKLTEIEINMCPGLRMKFPTNLVKIVVGNLVISNLNELKKLKVFSIDCRNPSDSYNPNEIFINSELDTYIGPIDFFKFKTKPKNIYINYNEFIHNRITKIILDVKLDSFRNRNVVVNILYQMGESEIYENNVFQYIEKDTSFRRCKQYDTVINLNYNTRLENEMYYNISINFDFYKMKFIILKFNIDQLKISLEKSEFFNRINECMEKFNFLL